jgi:hypothetical protein
MNTTPFSTLHFTSTTDSDRPRSDQDQLQVDATRRVRAAGERALVLGGGGSAGNAWLIGVIAGLFDATGGRCGRGSWWSWTRRRWPARSSLTPSPSRPGTRVRRCCWWGTGPSCPRFPQVGRSTCSLPIETTPLSWTTSAGSATSGNAPPASTCATAGPTPRIPALDTVASRAGTGSRCSTCSTKPGGTTPPPGNAP